MLTGTEIYALTAQKSDEDAPATFSISEIGTIGELSKTSGIDNSETKWLKIKIDQETSAAIQELKSDGEDSDCIRIGLLKYRISTNNETLNLRTDYMKWFYDSVDSEKAYPKVSVNAVIENGEDISTAVFDKIDYTNPGQSDSTSLSTSNSSNLRWEMRSFFSVEVSNTKSVELKDKQKITYWTTDSIKNGEEAGVIEASEDENIKVYFNMSEEFLLNSNKKSTTKLYGPNGETYLPSINKTVYNNDEVEYGYISRGKNTKKTTVDLKAVDQGCSAAGITDGQVSEWNEKGYTPQQAKLFSLTEATPVSNSNPKEEEWYELVDNGEISYYKLTTDTTVKYVENHYFKKLPTNGITTEDQWNQYTNYLKYEEIIEDDKVKYDFAENFENGKTYYYFEAVEVTSDVNPSEQGWCEVSVTTESGDATGYIPTEDTVPAKKEYWKKVYSEDSGWENFINTVPSGGVTSVSDIEGKVPKDEGWYENVGTEQNPIYEPSEDQFIPTIIVDSQEKTAKAEEVSPKINDNPYANGWYEQVPNTSNEFIISTRNSVPYVNIKDDNGKVVSKVGEAIPVAVPTGNPKENGYYEKS